MLTLPAPWNLEPSLNVVAPPLKRIVPTCESIVPALLLNAQLPIVVAPLPPRFCRVPVLVKTGRGPETVSAVSANDAQIPALSTVAPLLPCTLPSSHCTLPALMNEPPKKRFVSLPVMIKTSPAGSGLGAVTSGAKSPTVQENVALNPTEGSALIASATSRARHANGAGTVRAP